MKLPISLLASCGLALVLAAGLAACSSSDSDTPSQPNTGDAGDAGVGTPGDEWSIGPEAKVDVEASSETATDVSQDPSQDSQPESSTPDDSQSDTQPEDTQQPEDSEPKDVVTDNDILDAGCPAAGLGEVVCTCNLLDDSEWNSSSPFLYENSVDFGTTGWNVNLLTPGGYQIYVDGNLGGSSDESEITAFEMLARCDYATLLKSEKKIDYIDAGKRTDILVSIDGRKVGVSVVRAYHYPPSNPYTVEEATTILTKKLTEIPMAAALAAPADAWERSILAVIAYDQQYASAVVTAWNQLDASLRGNVIVLVTTTNGDDAALYSN